MRQQQPAARRACVRFETAPAQEAQFDWKGPVSGLLASAPEQKLYFFRLVMGYSRYRITRLVRLQTLPAVLADLMDVLATLGGLPQRLVFDNFGAAVLKPRPNLRLHPFFADFCDHYGIEPAPALPYSPQRKGKTERSFRDLAESDLLHQVYADPADIQRALDRADEQYNRRVHTTTGETPTARLERERPFLMALPAVPFDPRLPETRQVLSDCTISYHAVYYSVPYQLVGKRLTVKTDPRIGQIEIFDGADIVATHQQAAKGQRVIVEEHIADLRKPRWDRLRRAGAPATRNHKFNRVRRAAARALAQGSGRLPPHCRLHQSDRGGGAMNELQLDRILNHCQRLGLTHVQAGLSDSLRRAETESWGHLQLLDQLLEEEIASRESRRIRNALKLAAFPFLKTLDAFDFAFQPSLDRARVMDLAALSFLQRKENVLLLGPPGVGKTHLAIALAVRACQHGASVYFSSLDSMIRALSAADAAGKLSHSPIDHDASPRSYRQHHAPI